MAQSVLARMGIREVAAPAQEAMVALPWRQMPADTAAWHELAQRASEPNPFFESWYLFPSLEQFDREHETSVLCFRQGGALSGIMPVVRRQQYAGWPIAHIASWLHPNMFSGTPLVARGAERAFWRALLEWADGNTGMALFLHLSEVPLDGPVHAALEAVLSADGRPWAVVQRGERAMLSSDLDPGDYLTGSLPGRKRKDLDRRFRRLSELGEIEFRWETGFAGIERWTDEFLALEASGWKGAASSALACDPATDAVFRASMTGAAARDRLVRLSLRLDGRPIAMLSTFLTPPGAFGFKTAFDESYARFSPGILLEREYLGVLRRFGIRWSDSCAAADHSVMNRLWRERRPFGRVSIAIGGPLRRAVFSQMLRKETARINSEARP